jgi:SOS-response transcriptional repressor LexA
MPSSNTLGSRLRAARKAARLTLAEVAHHFEHSLAAVQQWERDKTVPSSEKIIRFAKITGADLMWVMTGAGQLGDEAMARERQPADGRTRAIPKLSLQQAARGTPKEGHALNGTALSYFASSETAFSIVIPDSSNAPRFEVGDRVVIDPEVTPLPGDMVLGLAGDERQPLFRKYRIESGARGKLVVLEPLNTDWPSEAETASKIEILGVMTEHTKPRR